MLIVLKTLHLGGIQTRSRLRTETMTTIPHRKGIFESVSIFLGILSLRPKKAWTWDRCSDDNFLRFSTLKNNDIISFLHNLALFYVKNANFPPIFFSRLEYSGKHAASRKA
jgi:hypothetical protein